MNNNSQYIGINSTNNNNNSGNNLNRLSKKKSNSFNNIIGNNDYHHNQHQHNYTNNTTKSPVTSSQQHHFVNKIFSSLFYSQHLTFNQFIYGLKLIGIEIQTERKFVKIKTIFDELRIKGEEVIEYQQGVRTGARLLREEKGKIGSELTHLERGYYHMVVQGNHINIPCSEQVSSLPELKAHIVSITQSEYQPQHDNSNLKHLTSQSLDTIIKYLGIQQQLTPQIINDIMRYADQQQKGYLTFDDIVAAIQSSTVLNSDWI